MTKLTAKARIMTKLRRREAHPMPCLPETPEEPISSGISTYAQWLESMKANQLKVLEAEDRNWQGTLTSLAQSLGDKRWMLGSSPLATEARSCIEHLDGVTIDVFDSEIETLKDTLFDHIDVGLSFASFGIAATGTVVIESSAQEPRSLSLVPEFNVIVADKQTLVPTLADYLKVAGLQPGISRSNTILVSSPSKTADIQQTLAYGAHGPRNVYVIVY